MKSRYLHGRAEVGTRSLKLRYFAFDFFCQGLESLNRVFYQLRKIPALSIGEALPRGRMFPPDLHWHRSHLLHFAFSRMLKKSLFSSPDLGAIGRAPSHPSFPL